MAIKINHKDNSLQFRKVAAPTANPPTDTVVLYFDSTSGTLAFMDDAGTEFEIAANGVANPMTADLDLGGFDIRTADSTSGQAKGIDIIGGDSLSGGGGVLGINITAGTVAAVSSFGTGGGSVTITAGDNDRSTGVSGGTISLVAGNAPFITGGTGGSLTLSAGDGGVSGGNVEIIAGIDSTDESINGVIKLRTSNITTRAVVQFMQGTNYIGLQTPSNISADVIWTLPEDTHAAAAGKFITAAAADGVLSFAQGISNPMTADLDVGAFAIKADANTSLTLDDTATILHAGGTLAINAVGNITIKPDNKTGTASTTSISAGRSTDGAGGAISINGGIGDVGAGGNINLTPGTGSTTAGKTIVTGVIEATGGIDNLTSSSGVVAVSSTTPTIGKVLTATSTTVATWQNPTAASLDTEIQYNNNGTLDGAAEWTFANGTGKLTGSAALGSDAILSVTNTATTGTAIGILGVNSAASGASNGVRGETSSTTTNSAGVYGRAGGASGLVYGVYGYCAGPAGDGVYGYCPDTSSTGNGVHGLSNSVNSAGGLFENVAGDDTDVWIAKDDVFITCKQNNVENFKVTGAGDVTAAGNVVSHIANNVQTANYTLALADDGKLISMNLTATANTLTIPLNATVAFPIGTQILIEQRGTGQTTIAITATGTLNSAGSLVLLASQFSTATIIKTATDTWLLMGDLA